MCIQSFLCLSAAVYEIPNEETSYTKAVVACKNKGARLPMPTTGATFEKHKRYLQDAVQYKGNRTFWIGLDNIADTSKFMVSSQ